MPLGRVLKSAIDKAKAKKLGGGAVSKPAVEAQPVVKPNPMAEKPMGKPSVRPAGPAETLQRLAQGPLPGRAIGRVRRGLGKLK